MTDLEALLARAVAAEEALKESEAKARYDIGAMNEILLAADAASRALQQQIAELESVLSDARSLTEQHLKGIDRLTSVLAAHEKKESEVFEAAHKVYQRFGHDPNGVVDTDVMDLWSRVVVAADQTLSEAEIAHARKRLPHFFLEDAQKTSIPDARSSSSDNPDGGDRGKEILPPSPARSEP